MCLEKLISLTLYIIIIFLSILYLHKQNSVESLILFFANITIGSENLQLKYHKINSVRKRDARFECSFYLQVSLRYFVDIREIDTAVRNAC